jgi:hypothetical protein
MAPPSDKEFRRMEWDLVPLRPLQGGLHLHGAELLDGEVQVRLREGVAVGGTSEQQLGERAPAQGDLLSVAEAGRPIQRAVEVCACGLSMPRSTAKAPALRTWL